MREPSSNFMSSWKYYSGFYEEMRKSLSFYTELNNTFIADDQGIRLLKTTVKTFRSNVTGWRNLTENLTDRLVNRNVEHEG